MAASDFYFGPSIDLEMSQRAKECAEYAVYAFPKQQEFFFNAGLAIGFLTALALIGCFIGGIYIYGLVQGD